MDRKSIIILAISFALLVLWIPLTNKIYPPKPAPPRTNTVAQVTNQATQAGTNLSTTLSTYTNAPVAPATNLPPREEQTVVLESADARYTFSSIGGGIKLVELKHFDADVVSHTKKERAKKGSVTLNTKAPVPALSFIENGDTNSLRSFSLTKTGDVVRAETPLNDHLSLIKEFRLSSNYLVKATIRYENRSTQNVTLPQRELVIGTATPMGHRDESLHLGLEWYNGRDTTKITEPWFANKSLGCGALPSNPRTTYTEGHSNIVWAAVHNQFFTMVGVPENPAEQIVGRRVALPAPSAQELAADPVAFAKPFGYQTALLLQSHTVSGQSFFEQHFDFFAGPKEYKILQRLPQNMDLVMGFGGFFGFFAKALLLSMNGIHAMGIPYSICIIVITVIIKLLFWPLTTASTRSMKRMSALQPQMNALQEKYKDDPRKMNMKLMEFMKENKVSPLGGCLPLLLQIPVFFGFYRMLQSAIELRGAAFLWCPDLSQPDTIAFILGFPLNILPLFMAATMLWQARLTPMSPGMDPMQQQIMKFMPLMMVVFLYNFSAGLTLYWTVQNLLSIAQMKLTRTDPNPAPGAKPAVPARPIVPPKKKN